MSMLDRKEKIGYPIACNKSEIFSSVEEQLYKEHPYLKGIRFGG